MSNVEVEAYIIYLCAFAQPQSHQIIQVPTHVETPKVPPSTSTVTTMRQRTPPPSPTSTDTTTTPASTDTTTSSRVNGHDPGKFFLFLFLHSTSVSTLNPFAGLRAQHVRMQRVRTHNPSACSTCPQSGIRGKHFYRCEYH